jgi:hypothetical protein
MQFPVGVLVVGPELGTGNVAAMALTDDRSTPDWATFLTRRLDSLVILIRDKSLKPATKIARYSIIGLLGAIVGLAVVVMMAVGLIRLFDTTVFRGHAFITDLSFGGILLLAGALLLRASARAGRPS